MMSEDGGAQRGPSRGKQYAALPSVRHVVGQVAGRVRWMCYVKQLGAMLDTGAAGVVEMLLRTTARNPCLNEDAAMLAQVHHSMLCSGSWP